MVSFKTVPLRSTFDRTNFSCGIEALDDYLHRRANQDMKRHLATCFVLPGKLPYIQGFYTLSSASIPQDLLPFEIARKLPKSYRNLPVTLLGRLAIDQKSQGQGIVEILLLDALKRCYFSSHEIGTMAVVVDPINDKAIAFYHKYDFIMLPGSGRMFLAMKTIEPLFNSTL